MTWNGSNLAQAICLENIAQVRQCSLRLAQGRKERYIVRPRLSHACDYLHLSQSSIDPFRPAAFSSSLKLRRTGGLDSIVLPRKQPEGVSLKGSMAVNPGLVGNRKLLQVRAMM